MVRPVNGSGNSAPINPAPAAKIDTHASLAKNFTNSIINSAKSLSGGGGFKLTIAATGGKVSKKA
jgi:hypothetical protein